MKVPPGRDPAATDSAAHADRYVGPRDLTHWYTPLGRLLAELFRRLGERIGANLALVLTLVVGGGLAALATFAVARIYDAVTEAEGVAGLDQPILRAAMGLRSPTVDTICAGISYVFGPIGMPAIAAIAILVLALRRRSWAPVVLVVAAGLGSLLMTVAGKDIIDRSRPPRSEAIPPYETSPSFPERAHAQLHRRARHHRLPADPATPDPACPGRDRRRGRRRHLRRGGQPDHPRSALVHRRAGRMGARCGLARARHHGASPLPDDPPRSAGGANATAGNRLNRTEAIDAAAASAQHGSGCAAASRLAWRCRCAFRAQQRHPFFSRRASSHAGAVPPAARRRPSGGHP